MFHLFMVAFWALAGFVVKGLTNWQYMVRECRSGDCKEFLVDSNGWLGLSVGLWILAFVWLAGIIIHLINEVYWQRNSEEYIAQMTAKRTLAHTRWQTLKALIAKYLVEAYPEHEKAIMEKMATLDSDKLSAAAADFPELNASQTYMDMVKKAIGLYDEIYNVEREILGSLKNMRFRRRNPWTPFKFLLPRPPVVEFLTIADTN